MARCAVSELPALHDALVTVYVRGLADEGLIVGSDVVRYGMDAGLAVRSAFTALPLDRLGEPVTDELAAFVAERLELTRYLVDLGPGAAPSVSTCGTLRRPARRLSVAVRFFGELLRSAGAGFRRTSCNGSALPDAATGSTSTIRSGRRPRWQTRPVP